MAKKKVLLTGGSGFVGKNLLESALARKYEVAAPGRAELDLLDADCVKGYLNNCHFDFILHCAAKPGHRNASEPEKAFYENTRMFFNLARNPECFKKMLVIGSGAIYDMRRCRPKMKENCSDSGVPEDAHGLCKYICGKYIEKAGNIIDLRVFGVYGRYEDYSIRFISNMICKAVCGLPLTIKQNRRFDYIWVNDLYPVIDHLFESGAGHKAYNVTPDKSVELVELAREVLAAAGKNLPIVIARPGLAPEYSGDNSLLKSEMRKLLFTQHAPAIKELYAWYEGNKTSINRELLLFDK